MWDFCRQSSLQELLIYLMLSFCFSENGCSERNLCYIFEQGSKTFWKKFKFFSLATLSAKALCWRIADMQEYFSISLLCNVMLLRECAQMHPSPVWHREKYCEAEQSQYYKTLPSVVFFPPIWYSVKLFHASLFVLDSWVILFYAYYTVDTFGSVTQKNFSLKPSLALMKAERTVPFLCFIMTNKQTKKSLA